MTERLERALGHSFSNDSLLRTALTHRSYGSPHNERLEFLGDAALNGAIGKALFDRYPEQPEGILSRLRSNLVCQHMLHRLALSLELCEFLKLGEGELKSGGNLRPSILADALEALFGAVWIDAGFDAAEAVITRLYEKPLSEIVLEKPFKDAKSRLQEYLQGRKLLPPKYVIVALEGPVHAQQFQIACRIEALEIETEGRGTNRRAAEQMAAEHALDAMHVS
ncbi:MAG: ribonuclease III [Candidatus Accumulibacter sp.]|jgi:ribonuclease-3|nr:ribonuclease III [Accumulibacter sp.]